MSTSSAAREMDFEVTGYFEEIFDSENMRCIGTITHQSDGGRKHGSEGRLDFRSTTPFEVERGGKVHRIEASAAKPFNGWSMIQPICGRSKWRHPLDPK